MALEGPMLASFRFLWDELAEKEGRVAALPLLPLPVRVWSEGPGEEPRIDLVASLGSIPREERENAVEEMRERGFRGERLYGMTLSGSVPLDALDFLLDSPGEAFVEAAPVLRPNLEHSVPEAFNAGPLRGGVTQRGKGVIVGIIDTGIDLTHPSFRNANGRTRVVTYWEQSPLSQGPTPRDRQTGGEWSAAGIDAVLRRGPIPRSWIDPLGHGTAVAGVATGNGSGEPPGRYLGVAPDAELVVVALDALYDSFASSHNVVDAAEYIFEYAESRGKRAVVNLSHGTQIGPHQPAGEFEGILTELLEEDDARILVVSAGNTGSADAHARIATGSPSFQELVIEVPPNAGATILLDLWHEAADVLELEIVAPGGNGAATPMLSGLRRVEQGCAGEDVYEVSRTPNARGVRASQLQVKLFAPGFVGNVTPGAWVFRVHINGTLGGGVVDAWLDRALGPFSPRFAAPHVDSDHTITSPASAREAIAVGSYSTSPLGAVSASSARGPDRLDVPVELIAAPGEPILTAAAGAAHAASFSVGHGTSLAAAHVTGAIALMLETNQKCTRAEVARCLRSTARSDKYTNAGPATAWGAGKLDIAAALASI
jgi:subtilisin family serine protease